jgi:hypothetical protein
MGDHGETALIAIEPREGETVLQLANRLLSYDETVFKTDEKKPFETERIIRYNHGDHIEIRIAK